jgi:hypothetical protein
MMAKGPGQDALLELAKRQHGAIEVTLSWNRTTSKASVVVWNWGSGGCLQLNAEPEDAAYAFAHPYAYAAAQGLPHRDIRSAA